MSTSTDAGEQTRVRSEVAADWLIRSLLPELLVTAGDSRGARRLEESAAITRERFVDRYGFTHLAAELRRRREWLADAVRRERRYGHEAGTVLPSPGADARLAHLPELAGFVASTLRASSTGPLARSCVSLAVELVRLQGANDGTARDAESELERLYERQLRVLVAGTATVRREPVAPPTHPGIGVDAVRQATSTREAFVGTFTTAGDSYSCGHRHHGRGTALECARRLRGRMLRRLVAA